MSNAQRRQSNILRIARFVFGLAVLTGTVQGQETLDNTQLVTGTHVLSAFRDVVVECLAAWLRRLKKQDRQE